jgi:agmatinase
MLFYTESALKFAFAKDRLDFNFDSSNKTLNSDKQVFGILGVPFDSTSTYKPGARFGPNALREASYNLERYNLGLNKNLETSFYDLGNLEVVHGNFQKTGKHLTSTIKELLDLHIHPVVMGGEHTLSYGVIKALDIQNTTIVHFDAHLDLRNDYMGEKFSHATVMRRIWELNPEKIIQIGVRSCAGEEIDFAKSQDIKYYTSLEVKKDINEIKNFILDLKGPMYVTVDMDVLDPAFAPSVGNPVPNGLHPHHLQDLIYALAGKEVLGMDVVEVSATVIGDITSINGAQVLYDFLCLQ